MVFGHSLPLFPGYSFKMKAQKQFKFSSSSFLLFWTHCFSIKPLDPSILRDTQHAFPKSRVNGFENHVELGI